jgi:hypothetical protein
MNLNVKFLFELNLTKNNNANSRMYDVMRTFCLENYQIRNADALAYSNLKYDWFMINNIIKSEREKSKGKLLDSVNKNYSIQ